MISIDRLRAKLIILITVLTLTPVLFFMSELSVEQEKLFIIIFAISIFAIIGIYATVFKIAGMLSDMQNRAISSEVRLRSFMEYVYDGIFVADENGKLAEVNTAFAEMLDFSPDYLIGKNIWDYLKTPKGAVNEKWFVDRLGRAIPKLTVDFLAKRKDNQIVSLRVELYIVRQKDVFKGVRGFARLIHKKIEEEKLKNELFLSLYNELNEEINFFEAIKEQIPADEFNKKIAELKYKLLSRINPNYLDEFSFQIHRQVFDYTTIIEELKKWAEPIAKIKNQNLVVKVSQDLKEIKGMGDAEKIYFALKNILSNAMKFTPSYGTITLEMLRAKDWIEILIGDTGRGISQATQSKLFRPFTRDESAITSENEGTSLGLGLYIAKKIIDLHKGEITVESRLGKGTRVFVHFPLNKKAQEELPEHILWHEKSFKT